MNSKKIQILNSLFTPQFKAMEYFNKLITTRNMNLFLIQEKGKNGYYAESLENGIVCYISNNTNQISFLQTEKLITYTGHIPLEILFDKMKANKNDMPASNAHKEEIKGFFRKIVPEYNEKRVLIKYLRKIIYQFEILNRYQYNLKKTKSISEKWTLQKSSALQVVNKLKLA